jgi:hypothetical protein
MPANTLNHLPAAQLIALTRIDLPEDTVDATATLRVDGTVAIQCLTESADFDITVTAVGDVEWEALMFEPGAGQR